MLATSEGRIAETECYLADSVILQPKFAHHVKRYTTVERIYIFNNNNTSVQCAVYTDHIAAL